MKENRNAGIDLIKILACLGVVALHTLSPAKGTTNRWIALLATMSVPLFFMVTGYLAMKKTRLDWRYALRKIWTILVVCFCWEFLHAVAHFLVYREVRNFVQSFLLDFFQKGLFYHFWYMGALILVYLAMPLLHKLHREKPGVYRGILAALCAMNGILTLAQIALGKQFVLEIPQNLRIWFWLCYAMLGGLFAGTPVPGVKYAPMASIAAVVLLPLWLNWMGNSVFGGVMIESQYGDLFVQFSAAAVFVCLMGLQMPQVCRKAVIYLSGLTMGVYITHPFVLAVLAKFVPAFTQSGAWMNLLFWLMTAFVCTAVTAVIQKLPVLRRLLRL